MSDGPLVTILRDKRARGWPTHPRGACGGVFSAASALTSRFKTDAHFAAYTSCVYRRLTRAALDPAHAIDVHIELGVFDIDCPAVHGTPEPAPESWRGGLLDRIAELAREHPGVYVYMTRGGARLVFALAEPYMLRDQDDARAWSRDYCCAVAYLERRFGIVADIACCDWQRLFRLPRATRTPGAEPEQWPSYGDPYRIGALRIKVTREDVAAAKRAKPNLFTKPRATVPEAPRARARSTTRTTNASDPLAAVSGECVFYRLLDARGDIIRPHYANMWIVRCPNETAHTSGETGDTSTVLFAPRPGESLGWIHCSHGHCAGLTVHAWLEMFTNSEITAARRACLVRVA